MGRQRNNSNNKRVAHTQRDNRYNRGNKVTMIKCPTCSANSTLKEFSNQTEVWAKCSRCDSSGYNARISNNHLIEAIDIVSTIVDARD
jgi:transcription elongation factor Elf1